MKRLTINDLRLMIGSALSRFTFHVSRLTPRSSLFAFHLPLAALILLFFHKMAFSNLILARGDTFLYFYPYWNAAAEALQNGRIPLWNPDLFMGAPFVANSQVGFFYPLNWLAWWVLPTPYAVSASILLHLFIVGWGTWLAGRRALNLGKTAALFSAVLFALGGYLTAQVEHINQLQGLAWLPWFFVVLAYCAAEKEQPRWVVIGRSACGIALLFALQLLAGHTQTAFITGTALLIWSGFTYSLRYVTRHTPHELRFMFHVSRFTASFPLALFIGLLLAVGLTAVQLLPTLELIGLSSRQGGLTPNEVLSFSLHPLLLTRAILPGYGQSLFSEYVAFVPITAIFLAFIGAWQWRKWPGVLPAVALVLVGLFLALGVFNPFNWILARLPGFNLFRVPARWLVLVAFGVSLLAGLGWQIVLDRWLLSVRQWADVPARAQENLWHIERPLRAALFAILGLVGWGVLATFLAFFIPTGAEAPYEAPSLLTTLAWMIELLIAYLLLSGQRLGLKRWRLQVRQTAVSNPTSFLFITLLSLFLASRTHPYNNLTTPEAWFDLRPPVTRLWAEGGQYSVLSNQYSVNSHSQFTISSFRFLSLSGIFFDPGDQAEIDTIYADQLPEAARYDYTVAIKQKEIIGPNLSMAYGLAAVDGFDGGILPLRAYTELMGLILPPGVSSTDGRLREYLDAVPPAKWLDLFNARYLITDKTGDEWREGVFFDKQHAVLVDEAVSVGHVPAFVADELWLIVDGLPGEVVVETADSHTWQLTPQLLQDELYRVVLPETAVLQHITLSAAASPSQLLALSLVNTTNNTFQALVPGNYRLIHSGDVKIYENLDVLPRVLLLNDWQIVGNMPDALAVMAADSFEPGKTAVLQTDPHRGAPAPQHPNAPPGSAELVVYEPERVVIQTESETAVLLLLTDAYYPGWVATVDGKPTRIYQTDLLFRGVGVPEGAHEVVFEFRSGSFENGRMVSLVFSAVLLLVGVIVWRGKRP